MVKVQATATINAPAEKIFGYITVPTNMPEIWPSMLEASDIRPLPNGGNTFRWVYKMAGVRLNGSSEDSELIPNQRVVSVTKGGIESKITWTPQPIAGGTMVTFEAEYIVPVPLLGRLAEAFIAKQNQGEGELLVANLKARMEA